MQEYRNALPAAHEYNKEGLFLTFYKVHTF